MLHWHYIGYIDPRDPLDLSVRPCPPKPIRPIPSDLVARLADRLHADGGDVEDWLKLVRAYAVLGDRDKAKDAAADARHALASRPDDVKRIDDLVKGLGLEG